MKIYKPKIVFSIYHYATTSTPDSVFILGGYFTSTRYIDKIAQFKAGVWYDSGTLMEGRYSHGAISNGIETMIIGGVSEKIEIWESSDDSKWHEYKTMNETISTNGDYLNPALFIVPLEYAQVCKHGPNFKQ